MQITLVAVPYHLGQENQGTARSADEYLAAGLPDQLRAAGHDIEIVRAKRLFAYVDEEGAVGDVNAAVAKAVRAAVAAGRFPLVLAGDCNHSVGTLAGLDAPEMGVVWCDAHADLNTPETSPSGYIDGMALRMALGHTQHTIVARAGLTHPPQDDRVVLVGVRDIDPGEADFIDQSGLMLVCGPCEGLAQIESGLDVLKARGVTDVHLHVDLDVLDPSVAPGLNFPARNGLFVEQAEGCIAAVKARFNLRAAVFSYYNPALDVAHQTRDAGLRLIRAVVGV